MIKNVKVDTRLVELTRKIHEKVDALNQVLTMAADNGLEVEITTATVRLPAQDKASPMVMVKVRQNMDRFVGDVYDE